MVRSVALRDPGRRARRRCRSRGPSAGVASPLCERATQRTPCATESVPHRRAGAYAPSPTRGSATVTAAATEGRKFRDYSELTIRGLASNTGDVDPVSFSSSNDHVGAIVDVVVSETVVGGLAHPAVVATHVVAPAGAPIVPFDEVAVIG